MCLLNFSGDVYINISVNKTSRLTTSRKTNIDCTAIHIRAYLELSIKNGKTVATKIFTAIHIAKKQKVVSAIKRFANNVEL